MLFEAIASAFWLGLLTAISPCPLSTNLAALSFISRDATRPRRVALAGLAYTVGRVAAYTGLAALLVGGALAAPTTSHTLQKFLNKAIGPVLVLAGLVLAGWIRLPLGGALLGVEGQRRLARAGLPGAGLLGVVFALAFCPASAAMYFGALLPLAVRSESVVLLPLVFGLATGLPVLALGWVLASGARGAARALDLLPQLERWARWITAAALVAIGVWLSLRYIFGVFT